MGREQSLEEGGKEKVGEEVSEGADGGVIRNHVTAELYILIRNNSHTPCLPLGQCAQVL